MNLVHISTIIPLAPDRSALLDIKNRVLLLTLTRLLGRFDVELPVALSLLAASDIDIRFDPVNDNPCLSLDDIPKLLGVIRPPQKNDRHNRQHMKMLLEREDLLIGLKCSNLINQPRALSRKLISVLQPSGCMDEKELHDLYSFMQKVALH
jgi:hypothetical protein